MSQRDEKDLFSETTMTFGEHIEELRRCLWKAMIGLLIGFGIGLYFGYDIVKFIHSPLTNSLEEYYTNQAKDRLKDELGLGEDDEVSPEMLAIFELNLIPEKITIEPRYIYDQLRVAHPDMPNDVAFPAYPFHAADVVDAQSAAETIVESANEKNASGVKSLWVQLSEDEQELLREISEADEVTSPQRGDLADIIDGALSRTDLYDDSTYKAAGTESRLLERFEALGADPDPEQVRLLNWFALRAKTELGKSIATPHPLLVPMRIWRDLKDDPRMKVKSLSTQEGFVIWIKASLVFGFVLSSPWLFWQMWQFVGAGLYSHEKRYVKVFLPFSLVLFWAGAGLAFFFVFQFVLDFLFSFNSKIGVEPDPRISEWLGFALFLPIGFGISFQLPLVMLFMERIGLFSVETYIRKVRISILVIAVLSMLLTPADPISMLLMFVPLTLLYFLGVALCKYMPRSRSPFGEVDEV